MNQQNSAKLPSKLYSEAVVHSVSGESLLDSPSQVTSENVSRFYTTADRLQAVAQRLRTEGFEVLDIGKLSITIAAAPEVYERSFQTTLEAIDRPVIKALGQTDTATFINAVDDKPFGQIDVAQTQWQGWIDGVAINEPIYYFQSDLPSAVPPTTPNEYLSVPDGVAEGLNATLVHQQGITGKGIKVVMVDSGCYPHPFFSQHNYNLTVCLAPGSCDSTTDESGHGTGESANVLAIAPDVTLTMVKADVAIGGKTKNINSISAFRTAVALQPDIISCSWGSDERRCHLSPYNRLLAAIVADAMRQGIIVVFSAGNGHYSFPAQHPEVIAAGGVYLHLNGSLRGQLEASNYASSFISPIYPGRQVPDMCGLVGTLPCGSYIMLPVPPGSEVDRGLALSPDGTEESDGWAAFSGTSAAAPQLAGICALMKQVNPQLSPAEAKRILQHTARDVVEGFSNPSSSGASARAGPDLATGYGLADADKAVRAVRAGTQEKCCEDCASPTQNFSRVNSKSVRRQPMYSQFPKLREKIDEIQVRINEILQEEFINVDPPLIENVEIEITEANFVSPSPQSQAISSLVKILKSVPKTDEGQLDSEAIEKKHVLAAESLIRMQRCQELAMKVLVAAISSNQKKVPELAAKALGKFSFGLAEKDEIHTTVGLGCYYDEKRKCYYGSDCDDSKRPKCT